MTTLFAWFGKNKVTAVLIATVYAALTIFPHDVLQNPALLVQQQTGMVAWHFGLLIAIAVGLLGVGVAICRSNELRLALYSLRYYALGVAALLVAGSTLLMVNSVEHIHYLQYAVLVLILSPVIGRVGPVVALAIFVGAFDEGYQYFALHPWQPYFDFNDIILNGIGALAGATIYLVFDRLVDTRTFRRSSHPFLISWIILFALIVLLYWVGTLGSFVDEGRIVLNRFSRPEEYGLLQRWIDTGWGNHWLKINPLEGFCIAFILPLVNSGLSVRQ